MSNTIAHRHQVHHHVPLMPVLAVIVAVLLATVVIWAINQPQTTTTTPVSETAYTPALQQAAVPAPESPVFRHSLMRVNAAGGYPRAYLDNLHHLVNGTTLDPVSTQASRTYTQPDFPRVGQ
jgi:hypothetical protein